MTLMRFGPIARHPEAGIECKLCERGRATHCRDCFVEAVERYRGALRAAGNPIAGEPSATRRAR